MPVTGEPPIRVSRIGRVFGEGVTRLRLGPTVPVEVAAHHVRGEPVPVEVALAADYEPFDVGDAWGPPWGTTWFRVRGKVPEEWAGRQVMLRFQVGNAGETGFGAESLVWRDGRPVQGLSPNHGSYEVFARARGGEEVELFVEAAANPPSPFGANPWPLLEAEPDGDPLFTLAAAALYTRDAEVEAFWHDFRIGLELLMELPTDDPRRARLLGDLDRACNELVLPDLTATWRSAQPLVRRALEHPAAPDVHRVSMVGHAHIDTAWLWPLRETVRKCARTFSTVLALMERYPEYRFVISAAQHLAWMRDGYPDLWERLRKRIAEGRIEPTGSMWVEADCNIPSGESLVRQLVHGKRFYLDELGIETEDVWLPDVFGYSAALPQLMRLAGVRWFFTHKLSWNQYNVLPHHTFLWEGIDGSRVFTHFPPSDTYGGQVKVRELRYGASNFADHDRSDRSLYLFGWGDGGGGPTEEMLESARRLSDLDGLPRSTMEGPRRFFEQAEAETVDPPVWVGELYLEYHRGTYTTQARTKWGNRRCELALRDAELWCTLLGPRRDGDGDGGAAYPAQELHAAWQELLVHQFHDIIPGSGIHWVHRDTEEAHARILEAAERCTAAALGLASAVPDTSGLGHPVVVWNSLSHDRTDLAEVEVPEGARAAVAHDGPGAPDGGTPLQMIGGHRAVFPASVPSCGYRVYDLVAGEPAPGWAAPTVSTGHLENGRLRVELDERGLVTSLFDLTAGREALVPGRPANVLRLHPDYPNFYDAWDVDSFHTEQFEELVGLDDVEVVEDGPVRVAVRLRRSFSASRVVQTLRLTAGAPWLEVVTEVDWHEDNRMLKAAFPVAVRSPRATFEIQYGHVERATHANTSWEAAQFEVCAQKWADLSEPGYGVAVLNDSKYGYGVKGDEITLSLLRSPLWPDPVADRGEQRCTYRVLPHAGDLRQAGVIDAGYELNVPLRAVATSPGEGGGEGRSASLVRVDAPNAVVEVVKRADDGTATVVVRLYEAWGRRGPVALTLPWPVGAAEVTDLLERPRPGLGPSLVIDGRTVRLAELLPFQVVTLRLEA